MKHWKKWFAGLLAVCMVMGLAACGAVSDLVGDALNEETVVRLVKGNIDVIYLGQYDEDYLEIVVDTEEELQQEYLAGLEVEAEYFAGYWGIVDAESGESYTDLDEELREDIIGLYKEIYSKSKYEVQDAVKMNDGSYAVKVLVDPIDIMEQALALYQNDEYEPLNSFWEKYAGADFSAMSEEDYWAYTNEYGEVIVQMVRELLPKLGYKEQKSQTIQVEEVDGAFQINGDDFGIFDSYVIEYP